jgi:hypothetical protein
VNGFNFTPDDYVSFTGPTYPGHTELLTPTSISGGSATSQIPTFATFAGQNIVVTVQDKAGRSSGSFEFVVLTYYTGDWTATGGKVSLAPTTASHGSTKDGQVNLFATDVEFDQCMVNATLTVYAPKAGGPPIAVVPHTTGCPSAEFAITTH